MITVWFTNEVELLFDYHTQTETVTTGPDMEVISADLA